MGRDGGGRERRRVNYAEQPDDEFEDAIEDIHVYDGGGGGRRARVAAPRPLTLPPRPAARTDARARAPRRSGASVLGRMRLCW